MSIHSKAFSIAICGLFFSTLSSRSFAISIESNTTSSSTSTEEAISLDGAITDKGGDDHKSSSESAKYPWALNFSQSKVNSTDADGKPLQDITNSVEALFGYDSKSLFEFGGGYSFSSTPNENLISLGPSLYIGYAFEEDKISDKKPKAEAGEEESGFRKSIGFKLSFSNNRFIEAFTAIQPPKTIGGIAKPTTGINEIIQSSLMLEIPIKCLEWLKLRPTATYFKYNTDVVNFLNFLSSARLSRGTLGLQSSAASFATFEAALHATIYLFDSWELNLSENYAILATDKSNSWSSKVEVFYNISDWRLGLGYSSLRSVAANDNSGILIVGYDF